MSDNRSRATDKSTMSANFGAALEGEYYYETKKTEMN
jgi:hypothetical protein